MLCYWNHSFKLERYVGTGGMLSSHSSTVACLAASVAMQDGLSSSTFAIAFIFAFIVVYDALNLRYQCGLHAKQINEINAEAKESLRKYFKNSQDVKHENEARKELTKEEIFESVVGEIKESEMKLEQRNQMRNTLQQDAKEAFEKYQKK